MFVVQRTKNNPLVVPQAHLPWESYAAFNGCPIKVGAKTYILYRAMSHPEQFENTQFTLSTIGITSSSGTRFSNKQQFIVPEEIWERYGCEDPRITKLGSTYYTFYTALSQFPFRAEGIKVGLAISKDLKTISEKHLITPFNSKAMALFPEKINGKFTVILSANTDTPPSKIALAQFENEEDMWNEKLWNTWYKNIDKNTLNLKRKDDDQVEVGAPPIKTKHGWLIIYSHIQKYFSNDKIFGVEAVLLDLKNPQKIIGRTSGPILVPETAYEKYGVISNIIFPTGALVEKDTLKIFYGGADTVCASAEVNLSELLESMKGKDGALFSRSPTNPILKPTKNYWENQAVFNPAVIDIDNIVYILYRAVATNNTSVFGYAASKDGMMIRDRSLNPIYLPREPFERKGVTNGNSGCEDPRITQIGSMLYMCYTAYNGIEPPAVALTNISVTDFKNKQWNWSKPVLISPYNTDDKDACIVPFSKNGKHLFIHRIDHTIVGTYIDLKNPSRSTDHVTILEPRVGMWDSKKVGLSCPPIKTRAGWLMLYHGISDDGIYRVGAVLLDSKDPTQIISRTTSFIFEPQEKYEREGLISNVVFPCGAVLRKDKLLMYYGAADKVVGLAETKLSKLLKILSK